MKRKNWYTLWGGLFLLCAAFGFLPEPHWVGQVFSLVFFLPPAALLWQGRRQDRLLIRNLSALSLGITLVTLILNFVLAVGSQTLGTILHYVLAVVSAPMVASGHWALSLFGWACLLMAGLRK